MRELLEKLDRLGLRGDSLKVAPSPDREALEAEPDPPADVKGGIIKSIAESLPDPSTQPSRRTPDADYEWHLTSDDLRLRKIPKGATLRRFTARIQRLLDAEGGYVHMSQAIRSNNSEERAAAVRELAQAGEHAKLARVAEHCVHLQTRKQAVEELYQQKAILALEEVAFFAKPPPPPPPKAEPSEEHVKRFGTGASIDEDYDEVRNLAVDRVADLAQQRYPGALDCLKRLARYDFSVHGYAQFRAIQRLALVMDYMAELEDFDGLVLLYNQTRSSKTRDAVVRLLEKAMPRILEVGHFDALHLLADSSSPLAPEAEDALQALESSQPE